MLLDILNKMPPCLCRILAREDGRALSLAELSERTGIDKSYLSKLSRRDKWDGTKIDTIEAFADACGVDLLHPRRQIDYLKRRRLSHITKSNNKDYYSKLFNLLIKPERRIDEFTHVYR